MHPTPYVTERQLGDLAVYKIQAESGSGPEKTIHSIHNSLLLVGEFVGPLLTKEGVHKSPRRSTTRQSTHCAKQEVHEPIGHWHEPNSESEKDYCKRLDLGTGVCRPQCGTHPSCVPLMGGG